MQSAKDHKTNLILEIPECELYEIKHPEQKLLQKGSLQVFELQEMKLYFLVINDFKYTLSKEIPIMTTDMPLDQRLYVLPNVGSYYGIRFAPRKDYEMLELFEGILNEEANLISPEAETITVDRSEEKEEKPLMAAKNERPVAVASKNDAAAPKEKTSKKVSEYLYQLGDKTREGLIAAGKIMGTQIGKGGQYIITKIKKNTKEKKFSEETKQKFRLANNCSKAVLTFTKAQLEGMMELCKAIGSEGVVMLENTKTGKKMTQNKNYEGAKEVGKATVHAVSAVFDGMIDALYTMGKSAGYAVTDVVAYKYGDDAGAVTKDGLQAVGQVGMVFRAPKDVAVKAITEATAKK